MGKLACHPSGRRQLEVAHELVVELARRDEPGEAVAGICPQRCRTPSSHRGQQLTEIDAHCPGPGADGERAERHPEALLTSVAGTLLSAHPEARVLEIAQVRVPGPE